MILLVTPCMVDVEIICYSRFASVPFIYHIFSCILSNVLRRYPVTNGEGSGRLISQGTILGLVVLANSFIPPMLVTDTYLVPYAFELATFLNPNSCTHLFLKVDDKSLILIFIG